MIADATRGAEQGRTAPSSSRRTLLQSLSFFMSPALSYYVSATASRRSEWRTPAIPQGNDGATRLVKRHLVVRY